MEKGDKEEMKKAEDPTFENPKKALKTAHKSDGVTLELDASNDPKKFLKKQMRQSGKRKLISVSRKRLTTNRT